MLRIKFYAPMVMSSKFSWRHWKWTGPTENLFDLSRDDLQVFKLLVEEAVCSNG